MKEVGIFSEALEVLLLRNIFVPFLFFENGLSISWEGFVLRFGPLGV